MSHPAVKNHDLLYNWLYAHAGRTPYWTFPDRINGETLRLDRLTFDNYHGLQDLFGGDDNPFLEKRFRSLSSLHEYVGYLMALFPYSLKHGGVDYLIHLPDDRLAGVVHLYDLSVETGREDRGYIGFHVGRAYRGTAVAHHAVTLLEDYAYNGRGLARLLAETYEENDRSTRFLERRGYVHLDTHHRVRTYQKLSPHQKLSP